MYIFVEANCFIFRIHGSPVHAVFEMLKSIWSSITHENIWGIKSKKGANVLCAVTKTLVQGTNNANGPSICLNRFMWLMVLDKGSTESILVCCIIRRFIHWTKQHRSRVLYWWSLMKSFHVCWWYLCLLPKCARVAKHTWCVSGLGRIAWNYFQLQQNCLYDV